jgi:hypothetical protein
MYKRTRTVQWTRSPYGERSPQVLLSIDNLGAHDTPSLPGPAHPDSNLVIVLGGDHARISTAISIPSPSRMIHLRELGSTVIDDTRFQSNHSLKVFGRWSILERSPEFPRLAIIFAYGNAERCSRTPALCLVIPRPRKVSAIEFTW